ncbi:MAG: hypothetical protein HYY20_12550 [Candidatus Tectomicrobia bacterium]|uniref:Uncharacterized protein n=1 Tax=Tectimicrobiota bacterium TaxID=2528274 RepID=A0A932CRA5_UNCTE|nr:hypothetical protein [Candidatus Tectomicrobia bacterium]
MKGAQRHPGNAPSNPFEPVKGLRHEVEVVSLAWRETEHVPEIGRQDDLADQIVHLLEELFVSLGREVGLLQPDRLDEARDLLLIKVEEEALGFLGPPFDPFVRKARAAVLELLQERIDETVQRLSGGWHTPDQKTEDLTENGVHDSISIGPWPATGRGTVPESANYPACLIIGTYVPSPVPYPGLLSEDWNLLLAERLLLRAWKVKSLCAFRVSYPVNVR